MNHLLSDKTPTRSTARTDENEDVTEWVKPHVKNTHKMHPENKTEDPPSPSRTAREKKGQCRIKGTNRTPNKRHAKNKAGKSSQGEKAWIK